MTPEFFDVVRGQVFGGKLTTGQVDGLNRIITYARRYDFARLHLAYVLATTTHETAFWMQPIREGARRFGTAYTDAQSRRAVANAVAKGIIKKNYALPAKNGHSYYGRGLVQITHLDNYAKLGKIIGVDLAGNPDLALDWEVALPITFVGMAQGVFRAGHRLDMIQSTDDFRAARNIINGDIKTNGSIIAGYALAYHSALETIYGH